jgi:hypothetical protein
MKWFKTLLLSLAIFGITSTPSHAIFGIGDIVFDPSTFSQAVISAMNQIRQYAQQCQQYATQLKQLEAQMQNLRGLNYMIDLAGFQDMQRIINSSRGIAGDYAQMQSQYDQVYPEFSRFSAMSGKDYATKALAVEPGDGEYEPGRDGSHQQVKGLVLFRHRGPEKAHRQGQQCCRGQRRIAGNRPDRGSSIQAACTASTDYGCIGKVRRRLYGSEGLNRKRRQGKEKKDFGKTQHLKNT